MEKDIYLHPYCRRMPDAESLRRINLDNLKDIEFQIVEEWSAEDIVRLYKAGGWWRDNYDPKGIPKLITGSFAFAVAVDVQTGRAIGMGRVISDGVSDAYIQDIVVLEAWRGNGIGVRLVKILLEHCIRERLLWIGLVAKPGMRSFYTPLGFEILPGEPMVYRPEE